MHSLVKDNFSQFEKNLEFFKTDINSLRTGRVSPSLVEKILVESYGTKTELLQLASIMSPEPQTIVIKPWDRNILKDIERAITSSDIRVNPVIDGDLVRLNFPSLTEENRKELVKILHKKLEDGRVTIKMTREKIKDEVLAAEREKIISEDEKFQALEDLDDVTKEFNEKIKQLGEAKEKEIMTI